MDEERPNAEAIHIIGNIIHGVGSNKEILANKNKKTQIISVEGRTIMPGFIDSHVHIFPGSVSLEGLNLKAAYTFDEVKNLILEYVKIIKIELLLRVKQRTILFSKNSILQAPIR